MHLYFRRPAGRLSTKRLRGTGVDLKTNLGFVVGAPSVHPDTGQCYIRVDAPVAAPTPWLVQYLRPEPSEARSRRHLHSVYAGSSRSLWAGTRSIADQFSETTSWADILEPHGWRCLDHDPDADGARWLHPRATSACSATIRYKCLFVYSTNTVFEVTEGSDPNGYTKFRAYAVLNHGGDMRAAARELKGTR